MSTLNALAQKHGITVPLRVSDCPKVLSIVKIDNQQVPDGQGGKIAADILTAKAACWRWRSLPASIGLPQRS